jgi:lipopolysaccharide export system permease protein
MGLLNQYLFGRAVKTVGGLIIFAMVVLLLERLLRIFQVVATSSKPASDATNMVVNLLPHYLGIAIPMALLLGIIITMDRLSKSSELIAGLGAGVSLMHITRPFLFIAAVLAVFTVFIEGYFQPVGRYNYRQVEHSIKQTSYAAALREGTFTEVGNRTFFAGTDLKGSDIGPIFIHEVIYEKGVIAGVRLITAERGKLEIREEIREPVLQLSEGQTYQVMDREKLLGGLSFEKSAISGANRTESFRVRGDDEREMTSLELFQNRNGDVNDNISVAQNNATLNLRLARAALLLILPFIAVPFGLNYGRNPSSAGIFIGVVMLVALQKAMEFAQNLGAKGAIPAGVGVWAIVILLAGFAFWIFRASAVKMGQPPLTSFQQWVKTLQDTVKKPFERKRVETH